MSNFITRMWDSIKSSFPWIPTETNSFPQRSELNASKDKVSSNPESNGTNDTYNSPIISKAVGGSEYLAENLSNFFAPVAINRIKQDIAEWRKGIIEMERPILPYRYMAQRSYLDTSLDPHIASCIERRKNLTLLRDFKIMSKDGKTEYENWTKYFYKKWFKSDFLSHSLDALFFGYSLISLGNISPGTDGANGDFDNVVVIRRGNISPDRYNVTAVPSTPQGIDFREEPFSDFHIWIYTPNEHGMSNCGYGLYYILTPLAIRMKNLDTYNADYCMKFGMPIRQLKTIDKNDKEKHKKEQAMINMADSGWFISDKDDELVLHMASQGKGYAAYSEFRHTLQQLASKYTLGHADALDSTTGKLGGSQGTKGIAGSPQEQALDDIMARDGAFIHPFIENEVFSRLRKLGIRVDGQLLPDDAEFVWSNDKEKAEAESSLNDENLKIATYAASLNAIGYKISKELLEEKTGLKFDTVEPPAPETSNTRDKEIKNYIDALKTNDPVFTHFKEKLDSKKKPNSVTDEEWDAYKTDREYKKLTKGFDGERSGMTKEEYAHYTRLIEYKKEHGIPLDIEDGEECCVHIGCGCSVEYNHDLQMNRWIFSTGTEEPSATTCQMCINAANIYNNQ